MSVKVYYADLESTGLLNDMRFDSNRKIHNFCMRSASDGRTWILHPHDKKGSNNLKDFLSEPKILVMHNGIGFDKIALEMFGYDTSKTIFVDTLALSWYLDLNRPKHGLESYGEEFGVPKPEVKDWKDLTQVDYDHRVLEDVKIQELTYKKLKGMFCELYGQMDDYQFCTHPMVKYLTFKMQCLAMKQENKFRVDVDFAKNFLVKLGSEIEDKQRSLFENMPKVKKMKKVNKPRVYYKKDLTLSAAAERWELNLVSNGYTLDFDGESIEVFDKWEEPKPTSPQQIKDWLFSLGWKPKTFNFVKSDSGDRQVPQVYIKGSGGMLCSSVEELAEDNPELEALVGLSVATHRFGCVKAFLDSLVCGDMIEAGANGFTNTLRLKHRKPAVNLPAPRSKYGTEVRSCLIAKDGEVLLGADLSALESVVKFNLQLPYDRKFVEDQMSDDFDPHLAIAVEAGLITQSESDFYKIVDGGFESSRYEQTPQLLAMLSLPEDKQEVEIKRISKERAKGKTGNYACLPMDTTVLTPSGFKEFKDLSVGDIVYSYQHGCLKEDVIKYKHFYEDADTVTFSDSKKSIRCTENHRWLTVRNGGVEFKELRDFDSDTVILANSYLGGKKSRNLFSLTDWSPKLIDTKDMKITSRKIEDVFCLTTEHGSFVIKQDNEIMLTGNCQYGAGAAAVARGAEVPLSVGQKIVTAYRELNWSIDKIAKAQKTKKTSHGTYQLNPFNGFWYHLKSDKDRFSTLVQGTGAYVMDLWLSYQFKLQESGNYPIGKLLATFHDEQVTEFEEGSEDGAKQLVLDAIDLVNKQMKTEIKFGCDIQFGYKYSDIH